MFLFNRGLSVFKLFYVASATKCLHCTVTPPVALNFVWPPLCHSYGFVPLALTLPPSLPSDGNWLTL